MRSGILRIVVGLVVLAFIFGTYFKFAGRFDQPNTQVIFGSTGIEVTWPIFLVTLGVAGIVGIGMIVLGLLSLRSK